MESKLRKRRHFSNLLLYIKWKKTNAQKAYVVQFADPDWKVNPFHWTDWKELKAHQLKRWYLIRKVPCPYRVHRVGADLMCYSCKDCSLWCNCDYCSNFKASEL